MLFEEMLSGEPLPVASQITLEIGDQLRDTVGGLEKGIERDGSLQREEIHEKSGGGVHEGPVATTVRGSAADFAALAQSDDPPATLIN